MKENIPWLRGVLSFWECWSGRMHQKELVSTYLKRSPLVGHLFLRHLVLFLAESCLPGRVVSDKVRELMSRALERHCTTHLGFWCLVLGALRLILCFACLLPTSTNKKSLCPPGTWTLGFETVNQSSTFKCMNEGGQCVSGLFDYMNSLCSMLTCFIFF